MSGMELPEGWAMTKLEMLATDVSYGYTASSTDTAVGPKMLRITDIQDNTVNWTDVPYCLIEEEKKAKYLLRKNDLVFARTGATVGKSFLIKNEPPEAVYASYLIRVRTASGSLISLLSYFFNSQQYWTQITEFSAGIGQPNVNGTKLKDLDIPLPPLAEQKVISEKLDTLLAQVETTKAHLERIPETLKRFRQSVLAAAVSGRLTEGWRGRNQVTPVQHTIANIKNARANNFSGRDKETRAHLREEEYSIPSSWEWVSLDSLSKKITDGTHHTPTYTESGIPFISVKDIRDGKIDFSNTKFISLEEHIELSKRCHVEVGDLLITKSGTIGRTAIVNTEVEFSLFVSVALIKPASDEVNSQFIDIALQKWVNEIDIASRIVGSAIKNLHLRDMKVLAIPFAPIEEQTEIVHRVEELFAFADTIENLANAASERVNNLTQSILAKAFRGELTAEWRTENPDLISGENSAEALLEKIKAEREAVVPGKSARKKKRA